MASVKPHSYNAIETSKSVIEYEDVLTKIASNGKYQWLLMILLSVVGMKASMDYFALTIITTEPKVWFCNEYYVETFNKTLRRQQIYNLNDSSVDHSWNTWILYNLTEWKCLAPVLLTTVSPSYGNLSSNSIKCTTWHYVADPQEKNLVMEWDLVCDRKNLQSFMQTLFMAGIIIGTFFGQLSDYVGRKRTLLLLASIELFSNVGLLFSNNMTTYMVFRVLSGLSSPIGIICIVLITEQVPNHSRAMFGNLFWINWCAGYVIVAGLGYWLRWWRHLQAAITIPCLIYVSFPFLISESPSWLYTRHRDKEGRDILDKIARFNGCSDKLTANMEVYINQPIQAEDAWWSPFRYPRLRLRTFTLYFINIIVSLIYFAISLQSGFIIQNNVYLNTLIAGLIEIPCYVMCWILMDKCGRRLSQFVMLIMFGLILVPMPFLPSYLSGLHTSLAVVGKGLITIILSLLLVYNAEIFPTTCRGIGVSQCTFATRIGGLLAPILLQNVSLTYLPTVLYGSLGIVAGLLTLILPETKNVALPQTLADAEEMGRLPSRKSKADPHDDEVTNL